MNLFEYSNIGQISDLVKDHFPQFYKEDGPVFIEFIQAYYEWLQSADNPIGQSRSRYQQFDIDTASTQFLDHYRRKYMWGLPPELLGNQRLLQKHILELYRSKGSQQAIRLLFRLLFNQDIEFYVPSYDIFKLSDNTWIEPHYIEITATPLIDRYHGNVITGLTSRATAIVENYQSRIVNGQQTYLLFISNIVGNFKPGEAVLTDGINPIESPMIKGSVVGYNILTSSPGIYVGDTLTAIFGEVPVELVVSETFEGSGSLDFSIVRPGTYYSLDASFVEQTAVYLDMLEPIVNLAISANAYGFPRDPNANLTSIIDDSIYIPGVDNIVPDYVPVSGGGAQIKIKTIKDTFVYEYNLDKVRDYLTVDLDGLYPFPKLPTSNVATIVSDSLGMNSVVVGSIESIQIINPGFNYSANSWFIPIDPYSSNSGIFDANGMNVGENGLVIGVPQLGTSIASEVKVLTSGYNNIQYDPNNFLHDANNELMITGTPIVGGVGWAKGYYENTKSFLSDDKYLFDGHYYQDFSYVIKAATTLDKYVDILKQLVHPAGNAVYGDIRIVKKNSLDHYAQVTRIVNTSGDDGVYLNFVRNEYNDVVNGSLDYKGPIQGNMSFTRSSIATVFNQFGINETILSNVPKLDRDPITRYPLGLLAEGQILNAIVRSGSIHQSPWNTGYGPVVANATKAPDGTKTATKIVRSSGNSLGGTGVFQAVTKATNAVKYTFSVFAKKGEFNKLRVVVHGADTTAARMYADFNLQTGLVENVVAGTTAFQDVETSVQQIADQWYRVSITGTSDTHNAITCRLYSLDSTASVGDGNSGIYVWGAQLESAPRPSSYIPTEAAAITRFPDIPLVPIEQISYNPDEGTLLIEGNCTQLPLFNNVYIAAVGIASNFNHVIAVSLNTNGSVTLTSRDSTNPNVVTLGTLPVGLGKYRVAVSYDSVGIRGSLNGQTPVSLAANVVVTPDSLRIGRGAYQGSGSRNLESYIESVSYLNRAKSNSELQAWSQQS